MVMILSLQVFHDIAALAAVTYQTILSTESFVDVVPKPIQSIFFWGYLGVDFFFVLRIAETLSRRCQVSPRVEVTN